MRLAGVGVGLLFELAGTLNGGVDGDSSERLTANDSREVTDREEDGQKRDARSEMEVGREHLEPIESKRPARGEAVGDVAPWSWELAAEVIAVGVLGEPSEDRGQNLICIEVDEVLKGVLPTATISALDKPRYSDTGTLMPPFSRELEPGTRVLVYLEGNPQKGWSVLLMRPLYYEEREQFWKSRIRRFFAVLRAPEAEDPTERYRQLLPLDGPVLLDHAAAGALLWNPDPRAADIVREMFIRSAESPPDPRSLDSARPEGLVQLLSRMHDAKAIDPVMDFADTLPIGKRRNMYSALPGLVENADAAIIRRARARLKSYLDTLPEEITIRSPKDVRLFQELGTVREVYEELGRRLSQ